MIDVPGDKEKEHTRWVISSGCVNCDFALCTMAERFR
jgi:hypothetical protein